MARGLVTTGRGRGEADVLAAVADGGSGSRALHLAATEGRMDVLTYLVEDLRLDVNQTNDRGSDLWSPSIRSNVRIVHLSWMLLPGETEEIDMRVHIV